MPLFDNASPQLFDIPGARFTPLASPSRGSRENAMWRVVIVPDRPSVLHHLTREEIILAVSGTGTVRIAGEDHTLSPGDAFAVPPFTDFQLQSASATPFEAIVVLPTGAHAVVEGQPSFQPPWSA